MGAAEDAYAVAERLIAEAATDGTTDLVLDREDTRALTHLPPGIGGLTGLITLTLDNTQVAKLAPLAGLAGLTGLSLDNTQVSELSPLAGLTGLTVLSLDNTQVSELSRWPG